MQNQVQLRREKLLRLLQANTFASVESLSERLYVSPLTVRRDLDALQEAGLVERMHGGARSIQVSRMDKSEISFYTRQNTQIAEKQAIAQAALHLLAPDEVLIVDASTTGYYFARAIPNDFPLNSDHLFGLPASGTGRSHAPGCDFNRRFAASQIPVLSGRRCRARTGPLSRSPGFLWRQRSGASGGLHGRTAA